MLDLRLQRQPVHFITLKSMGLALLGCSIGLLFLLVTQLKLKWFLAIYLAVIVAAVSTSMKNAKNFYLCLFILSLAISIDVNFSFEPSNAQRSLYGFQVQLLHLVLCVLFVLWAAERLGSGSQPQFITKGFVPLTVFIFACVTSTLASPVPWISSFSLFALLSSIPVFLYGGNAIHTQTDVLRVFQYLMLTMGLEGMIAVGQYVTKTTLGLGFLGGAEVEAATPGLSHIMRVAGTLGHPNNLALFFDLLIPLGVATLFSPLQKKTKVIVGIAVICGCAGLLATMSRGGLMATGLALGVLLTNRFRKRIGWIGAILSVAFLGCLLAGLLLGTHNPIGERLLKEDMGSGVGRLGLVKVALNLIEDKPLLGGGLNNYTEAAKEYDDTPDGIVSLWNAPVHNLVLFVGGEIGLIGLMGFLVFFWIILRRTVVGMSSRDPFVSNLSQGLFLGFLAFLIHAQVDYVNWPRFDVLWFLWGYALRVGSFSQAKGFVEKES